MEGQGGGGAEIKLIKNPRVITHYKPEGELHVAMGFRFDKTGGNVGVEVKRVPPFLEWTGERYLPWLQDAAIGYEHLHRYAYAFEFVQGKRVLDLACGEGYGSYLLARSAKSVLGVDIDENTIKHARNKYIKQNLEFKVGSITEVPIPGTHRFDVTVCFEALEHVEDHQKLLSEVKRLLTADGVFIVSTPNKKVYTDEPQFSNPFHVHELYFDEFKELLATHFKNVKFLGQRIYCNSNIWPVFLGADSKVVEYVIDRNPREFVFIEHEKRIPLYFMAIASDADCVIEERRSVLVDISDALLKQKDEQIAAHAKEQERLDREVGQLSATARVQQASLAERDRFLTNLQEDKSKLELEAERLRSEAEQMQAAVEAGRRELSEKRGRITNLEAECSVLLGQTGQLQAAVEAGRRELSEKRGRITNLEAECSVLLGQTGQLQAAIEARQRELGDKEERITNLEELFQQREAVLSQIYSSHGWKALTVYYQLRNKLLPEGTRRRAVAKFFWRSICDRSGVATKHDSTAVPVSTPHTGKFRGEHERVAFARKYRALFAKTTTEIYRNLPLSEGQRAFLKDKTFRYFWFCFRNTESYRLWCQLQQQMTIGQKMVPALFYSDGWSPNFSHKDRSQSNICSYHLSRQDILRTVKTSTDSLPNIDISLVTYNSAKWIRPFFKSLVKQSYPLQCMKIFVTDHSSQDATREILSELAAELSNKFGGFQIYERSNRGFGSGHNFNSKQGTSPYFLVSNVDLELELDAIATVVAAAEADEKSVASWEFRQKPYEHPKHYDPVSLETAWSSHACVLLRRIAFEDIGGYDETIFMYGEDVELSFRLRDRGYRLKYCPTAVAWHFTYDYPDQIKPLQFSESILNHAYIRLRYGSFSEILAIPAMYGRLLLSRPAVPRQRIVVLNNAFKIAKNCLHFLTTRKRSKTRFIFYGWDYDLCRDGAFYKYRQRQTDDLPLVSIIIRTFAGRREWLQQAVASVMNQTYSKLELVVVEDGSNTAESFIVNLRGKTNVKIIYEHCEKRGRCHAGNIGLSLAAGEFLSFLDDDDAIMADHIEVLVDELLAHPDAAAAYSLSWEVETKSSYSPQFNYADVNFWTPPHLRQPFSREVIFHHNYIPMQAILFRRSLYETYGGLDESLVYLEDWNLWVRYSFARNFVFVEKTTSLFRTPHEPEVRERRHQLLDEYYAVAREKNAMVLEQLANARANGSSADPWIESGYTVYRKA
jgi:GT2 family glycosyltransferase/SAM-dependent methyltransferase